MRVISDCELVSADGGKCDPRSTGDEVEAAMVFVATGAVGLGGPGLLRCVRLISGDLIFGIGGESSMPIVGSGRLQSMSGCGLTHSF